MLYALNNTIMNIPYVKGNFTSKSHKVSVVSKGWGCCYED